MPPDPGNATTGSAASNASSPHASIAVGEVRHARLRPRRHAFRYPALFVRLPMRSLAAALAQQRLFSHNRFNLFSFHDADHGPRVDRTTSDPCEWIDRILATEGIDDASGPIWLHTFPRVLGYAFKPVSFWFCHRADGALRAIVCEINNTFGERHCYLLAHRDGRALRDGEPLTAAKVFHVSPFCTVTGGYRFRFLQVRDRAVVRIDHDDADGPLIATSLSGRLRPFGDRSLLAAFVGQPLFSFGVIARIHWQALRLWLRRTPFFGKPVPSDIEVSR